MRFSEKEKLSIVEEGEKNGVKAVCAKYGNQYSELPTLEI
jgi:transposase-like protein